MNVAHRREARVVVHRCSSSSFAFEASRAEALVPLKKKDVRFLSM